MKRGRSTGKPTKEEAEWIVAVKTHNCVACEVQSLDNPWGGCDAHHLLSGGRRLGHLFTIGLCPWHHRGVTIGHNPVPVWRMQFGPSLMDGSKTFHEAYGSDEDLMGLQKRILAGTA
jgi:hypothetical protein